MAHVLYSSSLTGTKALFSSKWSTSLPLSRERKDDLDHVGGRGRGFHFPWTVILMASPRPGTLELVTSCACHVGRGVVAFYVRASLYYCYGGNTAHADRGTVCR